MSTQAQASDRARTDLHHGAEQPAATDREFPHRLRILVKHNGVDRRQRGHRCKESSRGAEQFDSIPLRNGMPCAEAYPGSMQPGNIDPK